MTIVEDVDAVVVVDEAVENDTQIKKLIDVSNVDTSALVTLRKSVNSKDEYVGTKEQ